MTREEYNGKEGSSGKKSNVDTTAQSTRRRALKVIGGAGAGSMVFLVWQWHKMMQNRSRDRILRSVRTGGREETLIRDQTPNW